MGCDLMRLSLIGTVHAESGQANVAELHALLERLKPDVIFAEVSSAEIDEYSNGARGNLESIAVARYRESSKVSVVAVDLAPPEATFFRNAREMFDKVERVSSDYRWMMDRHNLGTRTDGFHYLNSDRCIQAWMNIYGEVLATLDWMWDRRLREFYDLWISQNELREVAMIRNIAGHAALNGSAHGLLLVGATSPRS